MSDHNKGNDEPERIIKHRNSTTVGISTTATIPDIRNENYEQQMIIAQEAKDEDNTNNNIKKTTERKGTKNTFVSRHHMSSLALAPLKKRSIGAIRMLTPSRRFFKRSVQRQCETQETNDVSDNDYDNDDDDRHKKNILSSSSCSETEDMRKWDDPKCVPHPEIIPPMMPRADVLNGKNNTPEEHFLDDIEIKKPATSSAYGDHKGVGNKNVSSRVETETGQFPTTLPRPGATWVGSNDTDSTRQRTIDIDSEDFHLLPLGAIVVDDEIQNLTNERENERRRANELAEELARYNQIPVIEGQVSQKGVKYLSKRYCISMFLYLAAVISIIVGVAMVITSSPSTLPPVMTPMLNPTTFHPSIHPSLSSNPSTLPSITIHPSRHPSRSPSSRPTLSLFPSQTPTTIPTFAITNFIVQDYIQIFEGGRNGNNLMVLNDEQKEYYQDALITYTKHFAQNNNNYVVTKCIINRQTLSDDWLKISFSLTYTSNHINVMRNNYPEEFKNFMNSDDGKYRTLVNLQSVNVAVDDNTEVFVVFDEDNFTSFPSMTPPSMGVTFSPTTIVNKAPIANFPTTSPKRFLPPSFTDGIIGGSFNDDIGDATNAVRPPTMAPTPKAIDPDPFYPTTHPTFIDYKEISQDFTLVYEGVGLEKMDTDQMYYLQHMYSSYTKIFAFPNNDKFVETGCLVKNQNHTPPSQRQRHLSLLQSNKVSRLHTTLYDNLASFFSSQSSQRRESNELPSEQLEVKFKMTYISSQVDVVENNYPLLFKNYVISDEGKTRTMFNLQSIRMNVERIYDL